jgi:hypothetical protein
VEILFTWDDRQELTGLVIDVPCPSQIAEHKLFVSADYWGATRQEIARRYGKDLPVLGLAAASGDQSPRDLVRRYRGEPDMYGEPGLAEIARRLANAVDKVFVGAKAEIRSDLTFGHVARELHLPKRRVTAAEYELAKQHYAALVNHQPLDEPTKALIVSTLHADGMTYDQAIQVRPADRASIEELQLVFARETQARFEAQEAEPDFMMELHVLRLGDVALATSPFELFLDYGFRIKARSVATHTLTVQLACGTAGYLPTAKAVAAGGYSATIESNVVGPEGGQVLVEETLAAIGSLWEAKAQ